MAEHRFVFRISSTLACEVRSSKLECEIPAAFTRTSSLPFSDPQQGLLSRVDQKVWSLMSPVRTKWLRPIDPRADVQRSYVSFKAVSSRPIRRQRAPSRAKAIAMARPIPREAPVIKQVDLRRACLEEANSFKDRFCVGQTDEAGLYDVRVTNPDGNEAKIR